jgi:hypothetical protein
LKSRPTDHSFHVLGCFKYGNEPLGSVKGGVLLTSFSTGTLLHGASKYSIFTGNFLAKMEMKGKKSKVDLSLCLNKYHGLNKY